MCVCARWHIVRCVFPRQWRVSQIDIRAVRGQCVRAREPDSVRKVCVCVCVCFCKDALVPRVPSLTKNVVKECYTASVCVHSQQRCILYSILAAKTKKKQKNQATLYTIELDYILINDGPLLIQPFITQQPTIILQQIGFPTGVWGLGGELSHTDASTYVSNYTFHLFYMKINHLLGCR